MKIRSMVQALALGSSLIASSAFAHGPVAHQAAEAVEKAVEMFLAAQPTEVRRAFQSVSATKTGHEQFRVVITLNDASTQFAYDCRENEEVDPVVWECAAL